MTAVAAEGSRHVHDAVPNRKIETIMNQNLRFGLRDFVGRFPFAFFPTYGLRPMNRPLSISRETQLVIEGYPRSANTFAVVAFQKSNIGISVAHHLHAPAQIMRASKWKVPALVLIRNPVDAAASSILRNPGLSAQRALKGYCIFYEAIKPFRSAFVVGRFEDVVRDFSTVIGDVNSRFGTTFSLFAHNDANRGRVFDEIESIEADVLKSSRPNKVKDSLKVNLVSSIRNGNPDLVRTAEAVYREFLGS
jgi:hypothetical protein